MEKDTFNEKKLSIEEFQKYLQQHLPAYQQSKRMAG